jgi:hypothetical protein
MTIPQQRVEEALRLISKSHTNFDYFFDRLSDPAWITPLAEAGIFHKPFAAIRDGETISLPHWSPGGYLARMAQAPGNAELVLRVLLQLPRVDNPRVYENVAEAAVAMSAADAKFLVPTVIHGLGLPYQTLLPEVAGKLVAHLARGRRFRSAKTLARALFQVSLPEQRPSPGTEEVDRPLEWREPRGLMDAWEYARALTECRAALIEAGGVDGVRIFTDLLDHAIDLRPGSDRETGQDYSSIWCPEIVTAPDAHPGTTELLVAATRDSCSELAGKGPVEAELALTLLAGYRWNLFRRLALHLLTLDSSPPMAQLEGMLEDPAKWEARDWQPEYSLALHCHFASLSPSLQERYLDHIRQGPDVDGYRRLVEERSGHPVTQDQLDGYVGRWRRDRWFTLGSVLPAGTKNPVQQLIAQYGPAETVGAPQRTHVSFTSPKSPFPEGSIRDLSWPEVAERVRTWVPATDAWEGPSYEGLAGDLRHKLSLDLAGMVQHLDLFLRSRAEYQSSILEGLRAKLKEGKAFDWERVTSFLERFEPAAVLDPSRGIESTWVAKCAASLLEDGFTADLALAPPPFLRGRLWNVLASLAEHPEPTPTYEEQYGGSNMDPQTLSLNTVRGVAFHGVVRYGLWVRRHQEAGSPDFGEQDLGFEAMPEVMDLLDRHLDPQTDPSLTVRAVYGQWFPWLVLLDHNWSATNAQRIFSLAGGRFDRWGWSAWGAYIVFTRAFGAVLPILSAQYEAAILASGSEPPAEAGRTDRVHDKLAEHLVAYYWRGELEIGDDKLLAKFFELAPADVRGHALVSIGRALRQENSQVPAEVAERLMRLMEWRLEKPTFGGAEAEAVGWWFGLQPFPTDWSITLLKRALASGVLPEPDHLVVERLRELAVEHLADSVELLELMVARAAGGWGILGWKDAAAAILKSGLASGEVTVRESSRRIVDQLLAFRFLDLREILKAVDDANSS